MGLRDKLTNNRFFKSIYREGYPDTDRKRVMVVINSLALHLHPVRIPKKALKVSYTWGLGGLSIWMFVLLTITGVFLMFYYIPSVQRRVVVDHQPQHQRLLRRFHAQHAPLGRPRHGDSGLLTHDPGLLHRLVQAAARVQLGARRRAADGHFLLSFTGYLLPWDQLAYWAITVGAKMGGATPLIGKQVQHRAARRLPDRAADADSLVHAARDLLAARHDRLGLDALLAGAKGRQHLDARLSGAS